MTDEEILALLHKFSVEEKLFLLDVLTSAAEAPEDSSSSAAEAQSKHAALH